MTYTVKTTIHTTASNSFGEQEDMTINYIDEVVGGTPEEAMEACKTKHMAWGNIEVEVTHSI